MFNHFFLHKSDFCLHPSNSVLINFSTIKGSISLWSIIIVQIGCSLASYSGRIVVLNLVNSTHGDHLLRVCCLILIMVRKGRTSMWRGTCVTPLAPNISTFCHSRSNWGHRCHPMRFKSIALIHRACIAGVFGLPVLHVWLLTQFADVVIVCEHSEACIIFITFAPLAVAFD